MLNLTTLKIEKPQDSTLMVTLNRPAVKNAINTEMMRELLMFWQTCYISLEEVRCIILTASEDAFCSGADLKERKTMSLDVWRSQHALLEQAMLAMLDCPVPIIAAVNGAAYGGGLELALASDFIYATSSAVFSQSEVKIGIIPGALGTQNLPRAGGLRRAKELAFTAEVFSALDAYEWGIVNKICDPEELIGEALFTASKIAANAPLAVRQVKKALNMSQQLDIKSGYMFESEAYNRLLATEDREEGIRAFNEKRKPVFVGK
jgi:enoyl-CoA hydratase